MREKWNTLFKKILHTEKKLINKVQFLLNYTFLQILSYYTFTAYLYRNFEPRLKVRNFLAPFELGGVMDLPLKNNKKNFLFQNGEMKLKMKWRIKYQKVVKLIHLVTSRVFWSGLFCYIFSYLFCCTECGGACNRKNE